jgi:hypothetical protein
MNVTDTISIGEPMPAIAAATAIEPYRVRIAWAAGPRRGRTETVDLAPDILSFKAYRRLRDDPELFRSVQVTADGAALVWGDQDLDMAATSVERLAAEAMTNADFAGFLKRNGLSLDAAAIQLGVSRRLVAYYAKDRPVPRYIALACKAIEWSRMQPAP